MRKRHSQKAVRVIAVLLLCLLLAVNAGGIVLASDNVTPTSSDYTIPGASDDRSIIDGLEFEIEKTYEVIQPDATILADESSGEILYTTVSLPFYETETL